MTASRNGRAQQQASWALYADIAVRMALLCVLHMLILGLLMVQYRSDPPPPPARPRLYLPLLAKWAAKSDINLQESLPGWAAHGTSERDGVNRLRVDKTAAVCDVEYCDHYLSSWNGHG